MELHDAGTWRTGLRRSVVFSAGCTGSLLAALLLQGAVTAQGQSSALGHGSAVGLANVSPAPNGRWFGSGCGGAGQPVTIEVGSSMRPGFATTLRIEHLPPFQPAVLNLGASPNDWWGTPLPIGLDALGMSGCSLLVGQDVQVAFGTGTGTAQAQFVVPAEPALAARWLYMQVLFGQVGLNAANVGASRGYETRIAPLPTPTTLRSSIAQYGITFHFAAPVPAGQFVNGDWFIVGPATLVAMDPPCAVVNGRVMHGAMINPDASTQNQGYDSNLFDPQHYAHSRNVAWNLSAANPRQLVPNQSLIKVVSNPNTALIPVLQTCAVLTVLASPPPQGSFRPPYAGDDHEVRYDVEMLHMDRLLALPPAPGLPSVASRLAQLQRPWLDHAPGWAARYMHPIDNMPDYGRDFTSLYNEVALMVQTQITAAEKRDLTIRLVQIGIDFHTNFRDGAIQTGVGGHGSGRKLPILFAGTMLGDENMLATGVQFPTVRNLNGTFTAWFGEDCQTFYVQQTGAGQYNWGYGGYTAAHVGMPEFGFAHVDWPDDDREPWLQDPYRRCCTANAWIGGVLVARMMDLVDDWSHPALFDYMDRYAAIEASNWTYAWSAWSGQMWTMYRPSF